MSFNVDRPTSRGRPKFRKFRNAIRPVTQQIAVTPTMSGTRCKYSPVVVL